MELIDSHAHLNFSDFGQDLNEVITQSQEAGVSKIINIGTSLTDSQETIDLAAKYPFMYASVGIHPNDNPEETLDSIDWEKLEHLAKQPKVVAIGECGLDFSRSKDPERQIPLFRRQIELATKLNLPLSIHLRDAQNELMTELGGELKDGRGVFHCFSGDQQYLDFVLKELPGFSCSFAGNLTYKSASNLRELAKQVPLERLLVETDCPFLTPEPIRGSRNLPANVKITAQTLAELKGVPVETIAEVTSQNATTLFNLA